MMNLLLAEIKTTTNDIILYALMGVLIVFIALNVALSIIFIVALRKRAPVIKVVMAPPRSIVDDEERQEEAPQLPEETQEEQQPVEEPSVEEEMQPAEDAAPIPNPPMEEQMIVEDADDDEPTFVTEGQERVRYSKSFTAKIIQCPDEVKEWYTEIKNEILSYNKVHARMSWGRESFSFGRVTALRLCVRGKTLCMLLAVEPESYDKTKYSVEDVSTIAANAGTPTLYRIKSARRVKYAKEMIAGLMRALTVYKKPIYDPQDFFMPYEGTLALMQRGLIKRIVSNTTRVFMVQEVDKNESAAANKEAETASEQPAEEPAQSEEATQSADNAEQKE